MKNMSLAKKLIGGFGVILILLTLSGGISYLAINQASKDFETYQAKAEANETAGRIQSNLALAQLGAMKYIQDGSQKSLDEFKSRSDKTMQVTDEAQADIKNPEHRKLIKKADADLVAYGENFEKIVKLKEQRNHLVKEILNKKGAEMEQALTTILTTAKNDDNMGAAYETSHAIRALLLGRLYTVKFLDENSPAYMDRAVKELADLRGQLGDLDRALKNPDSRELLAEVERSEKDYSSALAKLSEVIAERNRIQEGEIKSYGADMAKDVEKAKLAIQDDLNALGAKVQAANQKAVTEVIILSLLAIIFGVLSAIFLIRGILRQLGGDPAEVVDIARKVAAGDLDLALRSEGVDTNSLFAAIRVMVESLKEKAGLAERIAQGDLTAEVSLASERDMLGKSLRTMVENLNSILGQIQVAGEQIASGSGQVADSSQSLSQGATEQASSLEEISASLGQLSAQTKGNAESASQANMLVTETRNAAQQGNRQMEAMVAAMSEINEAGQNISKIIKTIDEIAFQTNLLALNAAVEAARAGQHGKGFAVVAEEVRNLAARSAKAAGETAELIEGSVSKTENGSKIANQTSKALQEIVNSVSKVSDLVAEIATASSEQAEGVNQINQGVGQIDQVTQQNTANAEESAAAAEELSGQADQLRQMLQRFKLREKNVASWVSPERPQEPTPTESQLSLDATEFGKY